MAGLLKQLQRSKRAQVATSVASVLIPEDALASHPISVIEVKGKEKEPTMDRRIVEAEQLLADLAKESSTPAAALLGAPSEPVTPKEDAPSGSKGMRVVKRGGSSGLKKSNLGSDEAPTWVFEARQLPPHVEQQIVQVATELARSVSTLDPAVLNEGFVKEYLEKKVISNEAERLSWKERETIAREIAKLFALENLLEPLYQDPGVSEIFIDHHASIKVLRRGQVIETPFSFSSAAEYRLALAVLLRPSGQILGVTSPIVECVSADRRQCRVSALDGSIFHVGGDAEPRISIRIPREQKISFYDALQAKILPATLAAWLAEVVAQGEANILIVGPSGSGKTVMSSALLSEVSSDERVTTVEEFPEICVAAQNVEKLVVRPATDPGSKPITRSELIEIAARRTSRRIVLSELEGDEARTFLRALESGCSGCITSIHGEFPEDGLWRYLDLLSTYERSPQQSLMRRLSRAFHFVIAMERHEGRPCLSELVEVYPARGNEFVVQPIVRFDGMVEGKRTWKLLTQDSYWIRRIAERGVSLRPGPALVAGSDKGSESDKR